MTVVLTVTERCRTFPLDQMLDARRRRVLICLNCADDSERDEPFLKTLRACINCGEYRLIQPEQIIDINMRAA